MDFKLFTVKLRNLMYSYYYEIYFKVKNIIFTNMLNFFFMNFIYYDLVIAIFNIQIFYDDSKQN